VARSRLLEKPEGLTEVIGKLREFLWPVIGAAASGQVLPRGLVDGTPPRPAGLQSELAVTCARFVTR